MQTDEKEEIDDSPNANVVFGLELKKEINDLSKKDDRNFSSMVRTLVREALDARNK